ncbi:phosphoribosylamine--glycine ligase [Dietzia cercidiphylli]|uniref:Phosphoribosylamine--glycine ligase n=1 Tax=Dietzia cercidiphylli TaxID=498199 RepID=A0ABP4V9Y4_9ACTN|nr:phosphoribosylamine--glycine ligase [Dietzia cercidiphylli]MBB1048359.1 phosphoribosylamine--glycine ligase [Dietzia cercidiphylli]
METESVALLISALSILLAALSIGWQIAQYLLSAGRPKATLLHGLVSHSEALSGPVTANGKGLDVRRLREQALGGFEAVGIQVTNHGRAPVIIESVKLRPRGGVMTLIPISERIGPDLPHKLEPGANASWFLGYDHAVRLAEASREVLKENVSGVYMTAQLGTGNTIKTRRTLRA